MPKALKSCVDDLLGQGKSKDSAYAICSKSTHWKRKKGGGWKNDKTGEVYNESFLDLFLEESPYEGLDKGALHRWCKIPEDQDVTCECIKKALASDDPHVRKMGSFARNLSKKGKGMCK